MRLMSLALTMYIARRKTTIAKMATAGSTRYQLTRLTVTITPMAFPRIWW